MFLCRLIFMNRDRRGNEVPTPQDNVRAKHEFRPTPYMRVTIGNGDHSKSISKFA
jgi:hypothetical protein